MKILFITASLGLGGSEKCMAEMIRHIDLAQYEITILALVPVENKHIFDSRIQIINGYPDYINAQLPMRLAIPHSIHHLKIGFLVHKIMFWLQTKRCSGHLSKPFWQNLNTYISNFNEKFDVVIGYGQGPATFFAIDKCPNAPKKILWLNTELEKAGYDIHFLRHFYINANAIATDSENGRQSLIALYPEVRHRVFPFPNMLDVNGIIEKSKEYIPHYANDTSIRILTVGRMVEAKALHLAIDAAAILKQNNLSFKWYFIGDGSLRKSLETQSIQLGINDSVIFLGSNPNPYPWFLECDIYVQTSIYEGSCMTLNEAMVFNKPIVTTNFPAAYEKIHNGETGLICEMTALDIAEKITQLLTDNNLRHNLSENLRKNPINYGAQIQILDHMIHNI